MHHHAPIRTLRTEGHTAIDRVRVTDQCRCGARRVMTFATVEHDKPLGDYARIITTTRTLVESTGWRKD